MKFKSTNIAGGKTILYNDHYVAIPYDCSALTADSSGVIKAGTVVPSNDSTAIGILLYDVKKADNPNGTVVIHGFIKSGALPEELSSEADLKQITFI